MLLRLVWKRKDASHRPRRGLHIRLHQVDGIRDGLLAVDLRASKQASMRSISDPVLLMSKRTTLCTEAAALCLVLASHSSANAHSALHPPCFCLCASSACNISAFFYVHGPCTSRDQRRGPNTASPRRRSKGPHAMLMHTSTRSSLATTRCPTMALRKAACTGDAMAAAAVAAGLPSADPSHHSRCVQANLASHLCCLDWR